MGHYSRLEEITQELNEYLDLATTPNVAEGQNEEQSWIVHHNRAEVCLALAEFLICKKKKTDFVGMLKKWVE